MDLKCYVTVDVDVMLTRRTERNVRAGYGGSREEIECYNRQSVAPQHLRFNAPTQ